MEQSEKITGFFEPNIKETLREEAKPFIGQLLEFEALWLINEDDGGPYVGQWAMRAIGKDGDWLPFGWVPLEDIRQTE